VNPIILSVEFQGLCSCRKTVTLQEVRVFYRTHNQAVSLTDCIYSFVTKFGVINVLEIKHVFDAQLLRSLVLL
jgi:hypothetical protein